MKINPNIFRGYDIRGIVDQDLNEEIVFSIAKSFGTFLSRKGIKKAVVSRDSRKTSPEYSEAVIKGLIFAGIDVIDIGINLVGTFYWSQYYLNCKGGAYISASHNPGNYNGLKLAIDFSETMAEESIKQLKEMVENDDFEQAKKQGTVEKQDILEIYFSDLLKRISFKKKLKVVVDAGFATAGLFVPELFRRSGCEVIENNCKLDSSFPLGAPDPTDIEVAKRLSESVIKENADLGFSFDADGDRIGIVDDKGRIIWNDVLVALFAREVLNNHKGAIIMYNTLCSKVVEDTIIENGGIPFMWRTGHSFLKKKNQEIKAAFIGELSGHFFFSADFYNHDDGLYSALRLLNYLSKTDKSLSFAVDSLPKYVSSPEIKIYCSDNEKTELVKKISLVLKNDFPEAEIIDDERAGDGVRINLKDGMFVIRYSQNAPYLTVKFESKTEERYEALKKYINTLLHKYEEIDWNSDINLNLDALD